MLADPPRKRGPPPGLRIQTPTLNDPPRSIRNMNKLSLTLPDAPDASPAPLPPRPRRPSVISLPAPTPAALLARSEEHDPDVPYADGPLQIIPGIWLGSEDKRPRLATAQRTRHQGRPQRRQGDRLSLRRLQAPSLLCLCPKPQGRPARTHRHLLPCPPRLRTTRHALSQTHVVSRPAGSRRFWVSRCNGLYRRCPRPRRRRPHTLPVWHFSLSYHGNRPRHACGRRALSQRPTGDMGPQGHAARL